MAGVFLFLEHPELPTCAACIQWMYDDQWRPNKKGGKPVPRPKGVPTPCFRCPKIAVGVLPCPENARQLSEKNWEAYLYYRRCLVDTTGLLPRDSIVLRNNALIRSAEDGVKRNQGTIMVSLLQGMLGAGRNK